MAFIRQCSLTVAGREIVTPGDLGQQLRVTFDIRQRCTIQSNPADIVIHNLTPESGNSFKEGDPVVLLAGYADDGIDLIFQGHVIQPRFGKVNATDNTLTLMCGDGDQQLNFATISDTYSKGDTHLDMVQKCIKALGVETSYIPEDQLQRFKYLRGGVLHGMVRDVLRNIGQSVGCLVSVVNGRLVMVPAHAPFIPGTVVTKGVQNGLLGIPQQTENGIVIRCLMDPRIQQGVVVQLDTGVGINLASLEVGPGGTAAPSFLPAIAKDGRYGVIQCDVVGDTRGGESAPWEMTLTCMAADEESITPPTMTPYLNANTEGFGHAPYLGNN